jgi:hypothetical protein
MSMRMARSERVALSVISGVMTPEITDKSGATLAARRVGRQMAGRQ